MDLYKVFTVSIQLKYLTAYVLGDTRFPSTVIAGGLQVHCILYYGCVHFIIKWIICRLVSIKNALNDITLLFF